VARRRQDLSTPPPSELSRQQADSQSKASGDAPDAPKQDRVPPPDPPTPKEDLSKLPPPTPPAPKEDLSKLPPPTPPAPKEDLSKLPPPTPPAPKKDLSELPMPLPTQPAKPQPEIPPRIFISYRRDDTPLEADSLKAHLATHLEAEFILDVDSIPLGKNFVNYIREQVSFCDAMIVVIGGQWMSIEGPQGGARIQDPRDWVHVEIKAALERDIPLFPVLIDDASAPDPDELPQAIAELGQLNAARLRRQDWAPGCLYMATKVREVLEESH
jgi:hypothetical protein